VLQNEEITKADELMSYCPDHFTRLGLMLSFGTLSR
jgi:hypothetical protein